MVCCGKVVLSLAVVVVVVMVALAGQGEASPFIRPIFRDFPTRNFPYPKREDIDDAPLSGFWPLDVIELWYGHGEEGFSRNGRDVSRQMEEMQKAA
ncbi:hypothetical protein O3P69_007968 [Scylla paramamosain]|uniref:Uncharacterized protein n=1 Tax=Scylla paramamosain TaxID=85552 RepID=A0AAW0T0C3_SCYPA